jgi:hypothetical protein
MTGWSDSGILLSAAVLVSSTGSYDSPGYLLDASVIIVCGKGLPNLTFIANDRLAN